MPKDIKVSGNLTVPTEPITCYTGLRGEADAEMRVKGNKYWVFENEFQAYTIDDKEEAEWILAHQMDKLWDNMLFIIAESAEKAEDRWFQAEEQYEAYEDADPDWINAPWR
jgi:hypothetical protein